MALQGSASPNLSPILFKGNNRARAINLLVHMDESASMNPFEDFYRAGIFIGDLQEALIQEKIGFDVSKYPNLYGYFDLRARNPSSPFSIINREGTLNISNSFIRGEATRTDTITSWTNNYVYNIVPAPPYVDICSGNAGQTTGGRLKASGSDQNSEDVHGNLFSIYTTPNAISTGTPGRYGSIISSPVRKNTVTVVITNSNEQNGAPNTMMGLPITVGGGGTRTIDGASGELVYREYRVIALSDYSSNDVSPPQLIKFQQNTRTGMTVNYWDSVSGTNGFLTDSIGITNGYVALNSPFSINFLDVPYSTVYFGANGYFTFNGGSSTSSVTSPTSPALPAIKVFAGNKILNWLGSITKGTTPSRTWTVRWEGGDRSENFVETTSFVENGRSGMTVDYNNTTGLDAGYRTLTCPFRIRFLGTTYGTGTSTPVYFDANGYFNFVPATSTTNIDAPNEPLSPTSQPIPAIKVFAGDKILNWLGYVTKGTAPNRTWTVRWEGENFANNITYPKTLGSHIYEAIFYENQDFIDIHYVTNQGAASPQYSGLQNGYSSTYIDTWTPSTNIVSPYTTGQGFRVFTTNRITSQIYEATFYEDRSYIDLQYVVNQPVPTSVSALQDGTSASYLSTWNPSTQSISPYATEQGFRIPTKSGCDGIVFYGNSVDEPYGYVTFTSTTTFTIGRSAVLPNFVPAAQQLHNTFDLTKITRGALFKINNVYSKTGADNRPAFSKALVEFLRTTL